MKYFKIFHNNVRVPNGCAYVELKEVGFDAEANNFASESAHTYEDEDGNIDFDALEIEMGEIANEVIKQAKTEDGFDYGDYNLYIRDDGFDKYDIPRL